MKSTHREMSDTSVSKLQQLEDVTSPFLSDLLRFLLSDGVSTCLLGLL